MKISIDTEADKDKVRHLRPEMLVVLKCFFELEKKLGKIVLEDNLIELCNKNDVTKDAVRIVIQYLEEKELVIEQKRGFFEWE